MPPRPSTLIAELSYQCPLHCPYCSNPLDIGGERYRPGARDRALDPRLRGGARLGVLQLALTGGEPMLRRDLVELCAGARDAGLYSSLITAGTLFTRDRARRSRRPGSTTCRSRSRARTPRTTTASRATGRSRRRSRPRATPRSSTSLTINCVLHRQNLDRIEELLDLTLDLGAQRLELANTQYYGWAVANQDALMPSGAASARGGGGPAVPGAGRAQGRRPGCSPTSTRSCRSRAWAAGAGRRWWSLRTATSALPGRLDDPGLEFANVRDHPLEWIWSESDAFARFRGTDWMQEPCRTSARAAGGGLGRLPLPGAAARGRRGGHGSGLPVLAPSRPRRRGARAGADRPVRLSHDEAARPRLSLRGPARAARPARCGGTRAPARSSPP